jgi:hypothetical protein
MPTFFFDNDISFRIVHALERLIDPSEHTVLALRDRFPENAKDTEWIPEVGKQGWILISRDQRQRRRDAEHSALRVHQVRALYIHQAGNAKQLYADAARIIRNWPKIEEWGTNAPPGMICKLDTNDRIVGLG